MGGLFKLNMSPFGGDQRPRSTDKVDSFISYFNWAINIGSFLGHGHIFTGPRRLCLWIVSSNRMYVAGFDDHLC